MSPNTTEIPLGASPIALTVKASGSHLEYQWKLRGGGILEEPRNESAIFYVPPTQIDGESTQVMISVIVTDNEGKEATESVIFRIVSTSEEASAFESSPSKSTETISTLDNCVSISADGEPIKFYSVEERDWTNGWQNWWYNRIASANAKKEKAQAALTHFINEDNHEMYRFETQKGSPLFQAIIPREQIVEVGSCWKKVDEKGETVDTDQSGNRWIHEKTTIYVLIEP